MRTPRNIPGQFNLFEGERLKDEGIALVGDNNADWLGNALRLVELHAPIGEEFMAEIFKLIPGIGSPTHPNAWGALTRLARHQKIIFPTGRFGKSSSVSNHAHWYSIYIRPGRA